MNALETPLDTALILRKKKLLKRQLLEQTTALRPIRVAILGGSSTAEFSQLLELFLLQQGFQATFYESAFNRFYEEAVFETSALADFAADVIYIFTTALNITQLPSFSASTAEVDALLENQIGQLQQIWQALAPLNCPVIQNNYEYLSIRHLGQLDTVDYRGSNQFILRLNDAMAHSAAQTSHVCLQDIHYLAATMGIRQWFDEALYYSAAYAISLAAMVELSCSVAQQVGMLLGLAKKCLILDLDNTCWGGVIAEEGIAGIQLGSETATGQAYSDFQRYIKSLHGRGIVLAACSKNEEQDALLGLSHPNSLLRRDDFAVFKANWQSKADNIQQIAAELNLGIESLVFVDDNPAERAWVKSQLPTLAVPEIDVSHANIAKQLECHAYFDVPRFTSEDQQRQKYYQQNIQREKTAVEYACYEDFLASLTMQASIGLLDETQLVRAAQLINKTNQFNVCTKRYQQSELETFLADEGSLIITASLQDKFGHHGLVSVLMANMLDGHCYIDNWLMSCRVLKRQLEYAVFDDLIQHCKANNIGLVVGEYCKTEKNSLVSSLFSELGFVEISHNNVGSRWQLSIADYQKRPHRIQVNND